MYRHHPSAKFSSDTWHRKILHPLLVDCHTLWLLRNGERHGTEQQQKRTKRLKQLERDLIAIYSLQKDVLASDRNIFDTPIDELLTLPLGEIDKWIVSRCPIIFQSRREARRRCTSSVRLLPTYFHPLAHRRPKISRPAAPNHPPHVSYFATTPLISSHFQHTPTTLIKRKPIPTGPNPPSPRPLYQAILEFDKFPL
jgi:hypothetical protein